MLTNLLRLGLLLSLFLAGTGELLFSQRYFTRIYTETDGLPSTMVYDLTQDTSGVMWFATRMGVCAYDGKRWRQYPVLAPASALGSAFVCTDETGTLWSVPGRAPVGVWRFSGTEWIVYPGSSDIPGVFYFSGFDVTYEGGSPELALGTSTQGVFLYQDSCWRNYTVNEGLPGNEILCVAWWNGRCAVGTNRGFALIESGKVITVPYTEKLPAGSPGILAMTVEKDPENPAWDNLWLLGYGWLGFLTGTNFIQVLDGFNIAVHQVIGRSFIYPDPDGSFYFGNPFYFYHWDRQGDEPTLIGRDNGLITDGATGVLVDREKTTWITSYRGVTKIPSKRFTRYTETEGLSNNEVSSALEISPGHYLFGHHGELTFFDGRKFETMTLIADNSIGRPEVRIQDMDIDPQGNVWIASSILGIARLDKNRNIRWFNPRPGENFSSVVVVADRRVFASSDKRLFTLNHETRFDPLPVFSLQDAGIRKLFAGHDSSLICVTYSSGLLIKKGVEEKVIKSETNDLDNNLYAYFRDTKGVEWVGSATGLFRVTGNRLTRVDSAGFRIDRPIYLILEDSTGSLWFGSDNGIFRWDNKKLDHFTTLHGISGQEINRDAGFVDHKQNIWFGTNLGLTRYHPSYDYEKFDVPPPQVTIDWLDAAGDTHALNRPVSLSARNNNLIFHFHATSFIDEEHILYACKLEGLDPGWSEPFRSWDEVYRYNNLPPGRYRFCLKASNVLGDWSEPMCSAVIRIHPPVWRQWWFLVVMAVAVLVIVALLVWFSFIRRYNRRLEKMVEYKTRALKKSEKMLQESNAAKDNFFSIIAHDLKSPFNAILGMLELLTTSYNDFTDQERHRILVNLRNSSTRTFNLLDNLLTWAQAQKGTLPFHPERFDIIELIRENLSLFESSAVSKEIAMVAPPQEIVLVYADRNMINTVIRNLISNAIKFTANQGSVATAILRDHPHEVVVSIADTGVGIDDKTVKGLFYPGRQLTTRGTNDETGTGLGLILCRDFISRNGGRIWVTSEVGKGSAFWFTLPIQGTGS